MIRTETRDGRGDPIPLGIWGLVGGPYISNDMGPPGPMSLGKWGWGGGVQKSGGPFHYYTGVQQAEAGPTYV